MPSAGAQYFNGDRGLGGPLKIAGGYMVFAGLWIVFSDRLLAFLVPDPALQAGLQTVKGIFFVVFTGLLLYFAIRRYVMAVSESERFLKEIFSGIGITTGEVFFASLVKHLSQALECDYVLVGELDESATTVNTVACYVDGGPGDNFSYRLSGTPCADAVSGDICFYSEQVADNFPQDPLLREMKVESYLGAPLRDENGQAVGLLVVMHRHPLKVTPRLQGVFKLFAERAAAELLRRKAENAIQTQFAQLVTIFDSLNALVYVADMQTGELLYLNHFGEKLFGKSWRGRPCFEVLQEAQTSFCAFCTNDLLVKDGVPQPPCVWEFRNTRNNRWYQCTDRAISWTDGRLVRLEVAVDITEQKEMEEIKDGMVSAVSHEMRTPLTIIMGYVDYLLDRQGAVDEVKEYLEIVHQQSERLNELISNFLDFQRLRTNRSMPLAMPVNLVELIRGISLYFSCDPSKYEIRIEVPDQLPTVIGNIDQLEQVLKNLISNAVKYSPAGGTITVGGRDEGDEVTLWVRDEGIGLAPEVLDKIFDSFYRVDNSDRRQFGGAGLGLALVREIVRLHNGRVWAESHPGEGATVFVSLPVAAAGH